MPAVVTELVIDSDAANEGAASFSVAMAKAAQASNDNLKSISDNTAALSKQMSGLTDATKAAADQASSSWSNFAVKVALAAGAAYLGISALYTAFKVIYDLVVLVPSTIAEAWDLGNQKLVEYVALAEKATASGVSTDFFQRITKAATDAKTPVDDLTAAFAKLNSATADTLGGTSAQQRLNQLLTGDSNPLNADGTLKAQNGNFQGNTGVAQLANANTTEDKFRAIASLIDQAMQAGQRLAALDVAKTFLGDAVAANLAKDSDYLNKMLASADAIAAADLIPQAQIDNAVSLQNRLDAAEKILSERWHPIQDLLTAGGIAMKGVWVDIVEAVASAFDWTVKLVESLQPVLQYLPAIGNALLSAIAAIAGPLGAVIQAFQILGQYLGAGSPADNDPMAAAKSKLASGMSNPANIAGAAAQSNAIQNSVFRDTSVSPKATSANDNNDAVDNAINALNKHTLATQADADAVGLGAAALAVFRAQAQETAAVAKNGGEETDEQAAKFKALQVAAGAAADALAKAQVNSNIQFAGGTAFLSANDVAIATQLKGIYGNDIPAALNSTYASSIRVNDAMKEIGTALDTNITSGLTDIVTGTKSVSQGFSDMGTAIVKALDQAIIKLLIVQPLMQSLQSGLSGLGFGSLAGSGAAAQTASASTLSGNTGGAFFGPGFAGGTDSAPGGWAMVGENGPELMRVPAGSQILPNGVSPSNDNGGSNVTVNLIEDSSRAGQVQQSQNSNGGLNINAYVDSITAKNAANPGSATSQVLNQRGKLATR